MNHNFNINLILEWFSLGNVLLLAFSLLGLLLLGYFSKMEIAFFSLSTDDVDEMSNSEEKQEEAAIDLISSPQYLLGTFIIVRNLLLAAVLVLVAVLIISTKQMFTTSWLYSFISILLVLLLLIAVVLRGKTQGAQHAKGLVLKYSQVVLTIQKFFNPFVKVLGDSKILEGNRLTKWNLGLISADELSEALDLTEEQQEDDIEMIEGIIKFGNNSVADVMTPRVDMAFIDIKLDFKRLIHQINELGYSRMPVYAGNRDNVKGILFIKDLLPHLEKPEGFRWQSLVRQVYYVPETKKIDDLLTEFQENRVHLALVVDEHGGVAGLVTLEDIIEEIVGDISDEYDEEETLYQKINDQTYIFEAKIEIEDFCEIIGVPEDEFDEVADGVETLAGLILELRGELPQKREIITEKIYIFEILSVDKRRIKKVKLTIEN